MNEIVTTDSIYNLNCRNIYLDQAASSDPTAEVISDLMYYAINYWHNPHSSYQLGKDVMIAIMKAKENIAQLINCEPEELYFLANGSQANNWAKQIGEYNCVALYSTNLEHASMNLEKKIPNNKIGKLNTYWLEEHLEDNKLFRIKPFVSIIGVNNEVGIIQPIKELSEIVHRNNGIFHTDMSQAISHMELDVRELGIDLMTFTSEKIGMPRGLGVLYVKKDIPKPIYVSGGGQQDNLISGTLPSHMILAMGKQCKRIKNNLNNYIAREILIRNKMIEIINSICLELNIKWGVVPDINAYTINNMEVTINTIPNILSIIFYGIDNQQLMTLLDLINVQVSTGSACNSYESSPSKVLKALGLSDDECNNVIRISFDYRLLDEEIDEFGKRLKDCLIAIQMNQ